jgi:hypothetical protein
MDDVVVLPHMTVTLAVEGDNQKAAIEAARQGSRLILLVPRIEGKFGSIGTVGRLGDSADLPTGAEAFMIRGEYRARLGSGQADIGGALFVCLLMLRGSPRYTRFPGFLPCTAPVWSAGRPTSAARCSSRPTRSWIPNRRPRSRSSSHASTVPCWRTSSSRAASRR